MYMHMCIYIYIHIYTCVYIYIYCIYIYIYIHTYITIDALLPRGGGEATEHDFCSCRGSGGKRRRLDDIMTSTRCDSI